MATITERAASPISGQTAPQRESITAKTTGRWAKPPPSQMPSLPEELEKRPEGTIQAATNDVQPSEEVVPPKEEMLSPKYAELARREKAVREAKRALDLEKQALKDQEGSLKNLDDLKSKAAKDPMAVLSDLGVDAKTFYEGLTQAILNQQQVSPQDEKLSLLEKQIAEVKAANEQVVTQMTTREKAQYDQAVEQVRSEVKALVSTDENFSTIKESEQEERVVTKITDHFNKGLGLLTVDEACKQIEDEILAEASKFMGFKKIQAKFAESKTAPEEPAKQQLQATRSPTINSSLTKQSPPKALTAKEVRERAIKRFYGQPLD